MAKKRTDPLQTDVGFGKPPKATQFKAGVSGNPKGRPKGSLNLSTLIIRALSRKVTINEGGRRKKISCLEATTKQLSHQAMSGNLAAIRMIITASQAIEERQQGQNQIASQSIGIGNKLLENFVKRFEAAKSEGKNNEPTD